MSFDDDNLVKFMRLDEFRRTLMWVKLDKLDLIHLQPLRDEIVDKMEQIKKFENSGEINRSGNENIGRTKRGSKRSNN